MKIWVLRIILFLILSAFSFFLVSLIAGATSDLKPPAQDTIVLFLFPLLLLFSAGVATFLPRKYLNIDYKIWAKRSLYILGYVLAGVTLSGIYFSIGTIFQIEIPFVRCGIVNFLPGPSCLPDSSFLPLLTVVFSLIIWGISFVVPQNFKYWFLHIIVHLALLPLFIFLFFLISNLGIIVIGQQYFCSNYPIGWEQSCNPNILAKIILVILVTLFFFTIPGFISLKLIKKK